MKYKLAYGKCVQSFNKECDNCNRCGKDENRISNVKPLSIIKKRNNLNKKFLGVIMIIKNNITLYICEHCKKPYQLERFCKLHEDKCKKNPKNYQPCLDGCKHLKEKIVKRCVFYFDGFGEVEKEVDQKILWCNKHKKGVYPYWVDGASTDDLYDEIENNQMPNKCDDFDSTIIEW